jgi:hypothetical protein
MLSLFWIFCSSFGHLEGVTGIVRNNNQQITINNPLLRFERFTEAVEKPLEVVEKVTHLMSQKLLCPLLVFSV